MIREAFRGGGAPANKLLRGFTMAEVLITLGIIAIIAAMTLPNLIGNYKMKTYEVAFKKQYALLQNTINYITLENGLSSCYVYLPKGSISYVRKDDDCNILESELISLLNLKEYDVGLEDEYATHAEVLAGGGASINSSCDIDYIFTRNNSTTYISPDGTVFILSLGKYSYMVSVIIDVNGQKGPNKWGYDVFLMMLTNHNQYQKSQNNIFLTDEFCSIIEKGGKFPRTILRNEEINSDNDRYWP